MGVSFWGGGGVVGEGGEGAHGKKCGMVGVREFPQALLCRDNKLGICGGWWSCGRR